ncbi:MAG: hypothetical protein E6H07_14975 [Bacteroidetes bacterium]|nr:MAG: hypothetical protein E6H07_14975 [Bacteroidota bacterium]
MNQKKKIRSIRNENFSTGSHSPSSLRNVGPGYDDTGKGDYKRADDNKDKNVNSFQNKKQKK